MWAMQVTIKLCQNPDMTSLYLARRLSAQQTYFSVYSRFVITVPFPFPTSKKTNALSETFMERFPLLPTQTSACVFSFWGVKAKSVSTAASTALVPRKRSPNDSIPDACANSYGGCMSIVTSKILPRENYWTWRRRLVGSFTAFTLEKNPGRKGAAPSCAKPVHSGNRFLYHSVEVFIADNSIWSHGYVWLSGRQWLQHHCGAPTLSQFLRSLPTTILVSRET